MLKHDGMEMLFIIRDQINWSDTGKSYKSIPPMGTNNLIQMCKADRDIFQLYLQLKVFLLS